MTELVILPPLKALHGQRGAYVLTRKYMEGVAAFARAWPGPVTSLVEISNTATTDMDHAEFAPDDPVTPIEIRPDTQAALAARLKDAALVFTFLSPSEAPLVALCQKVGVPLVFWAEYSPRTERQIMQAETANPLRRWRRLGWLNRATRMRRRMVGQAAGLQCSGQPVYEAYAGLSPDPMVFWDNRVRQAEILSDADLAGRATLLATGAPLRLAFGGRLIAMKGVQFLPEFAQKLCQMGTPFTLDIYGSGPLEADLQRRISAMGLAGHVALKGALDFRTQWLPTLKTQADLFICPHPQGDPSSTYPETMSCGLPTVGFANDAFTTIAAVSDSGWSVPIGDTTALARQVTKLHHARERINAHAKHARDFALEHCFEKTARRRATHLIACAGLSPPEIAGQT